MKNYYLLLLAVLILTGARGQDATQSFSPDLSGRLIFQEMNLLHHAQTPSINMQGTMYPERSYPGGIKHAKSGNLVQLFDSICFWTLDTNSGGWNVSARQTGYIYDTRHNLTAAIYQVWSASQWINKRQFTATYNAANHQTSWVSQDWDGSLWINTEQILSTYDAANNLTTELSQEWISNSWVNYGQYLYTYDAGYNCINELSQLWNGTGWINNLQTLAAYDIHNNMISYLTQKWEGGQWVNRWLTNYTYDAANNLTGYLVGKWNGSAWENYWLTTNTYDGSNNLTQTLYQQWDSNQWVNYALEALAYDAFNNQTGILDQFWDGSKWVNSDQINSTYDADNLMQSTRAIYWNSDGTRIISGDSTHFFYHTVMGLEEKAGGLAFSVYPNPAAERITIKLPNSGTGLRVTVCDMQGRPVMQSILQDLTCELGIGELSPGLYLIRLSDGERVGSVVFVKK